MKTIVKKTITLETRRHDFDNQFAYVEIWSNTVLKDCFFAEKEFLFKDGSLKSGGTKYFYSPNPEDPEKSIKPIQFQQFKAFGHLYYIDENGEVQKYFLEDE